MNVGIIGSGTMGSGIAQVAATAGCAVKLYDTNSEALNKAQSGLDKILSRLIEKGRIDTSEKERIQSNISYVNNLKDLSDSNLTIEAIIENLEIKQKVFSELETYVDDNCIIASNTSSLSIASIASALKKPERCIGIHFFNPAPLMKLVEVIPAIQTSEAVLERSVQTISDWKKVVAVAKDTHCQFPLQVALQELTLERPNAFKRFLFSFFKSSLYNDKPWKQGLPTAPPFIVKDAL